MSKPLVSVIMPAYNGAPTIASALDSALAQTFSDREIIVVDDCSRDDTVGIVSGYGDRVQLVRRKENSGRCEIARSDGVALAKGRYCAFLDQDDMWEPAKLERQTAFMESHSEIPLSHTYMRIIDAQGRPSGIRHDGAIPPTGPCAAALLRNCFVTVSAIMVRPDVWRAAGDPRKLEDAHSDFDYFLSILRNHPAGFGFIPEVLGSYRVWEASMSKGDWRRRPRDVVSLRRVLDRKLWEGLLAEDEMRGILADAALEDSQYWRDCGNARHALWFGREAARARPDRAAAMALIKSIGRAAIPHRT
jgi:teichuronic acid biosynthesis glycosyltransferase TuaG